MTQSLDPDVLARCVELQRRGRSVDAVINRAVGRHGTLFERLARWKAYADAVVAAMTSPDMGTVEPERHACECGRVFDSLRSYQTHSTLWCEHAKGGMSPRALAAIERYENGDRVVEIIREAGISTATLYMWLRRAGVRAGRRNARRQEAA